jgi:3-isopropylmalate/(R)-2-methylmalate dehydratase small subunit
MASISWSHSWRGRAASIPDDDIDTDQIIPARFLKATGRDGLGRHLFADWRLNPDGSPNPEFPLSRPEANRARILVAGRNFGCGSSREHAAWALADFGFAAVVAPSFADIFRVNALKNQVLPIAVPEATWTDLLVHLERDPTATLEVDLTNQSMTWESTEVRFEIDPFARHCLVQGLDELGYLLAHQAAIARFERAVAPLESVT